jgi:hypothetical protein
MGIAPILYVAAILGGLVALLVADRRNQQSELPGHRSCPYCGIPVPRKTRVCVHCGRALGKS